MARYIDADLLKDIFESRAYDDWNHGCETTWANAFKEFARTVDDFPAADVTYVVRCEDCKYGHSHNPDSTIICEKLYDLPMTDNDFCSYGEMSNDE